MALTCSKCGAITKVIQTIDDESNLTVRKRVCKKCGYVQLSFETYVSDMKSGFEYFKNKDKDNVIKDVV